MSRTNYMDEASLVFDSERAEVVSPLELMAYFLGDGRRFTTNDDDSRLAEAE